MTHNNHDGSKPHGPPGPGMHVSVDRLLRSLDGEMPSKENELIDAHISACWQCRALRQSISNSIADVATLQNAIAESRIPQDGSDRLKFQQRLTALAGDLNSSTPRIKWPAKVLHTTARFIRANLRPIPSVIAFASLLVVWIASSILNVRTPSTVAADELIRRATASDSAREASAAKDVAIQKLRVSSGGKQLIRTVYRHVSTNQIASRTDDPSADASPIAGILARTSFDWNDLLSVEAFGRWRLRQQDREDTVNSIGPDLLQINTRTASGPLEEVSMTFRTSDYHGITEKLRLRDSSEIEIAELSYSVIPFAAAPLNIFGNPEEPLELRLPERATSKPTVRMKTSEADLTRAELEATYAIHEVGADLGEQVHVESGEDSIQVQGVVVDEARKEQLVTALQPVSHLQLNILTIAEAASQQTPGSVDHGKNMGPPVEIASAAPLLDINLKARFPDKDQRIAYVNQTLAIIQMMSARAWALNQLANQYPNRRVVLLDNSERQKLNSLLADHLESLREDSRRLEGQLSETLSPSSNTASANTTIMAARNAESAKSWQDEIHQMHSSVEAAHESVDVLIVGSPSADNGDPQSIEVGLRTTLTQLDAELNTVTQMIHQSFQDPGEVRQ